MTYGVQVLKVGQTRIPGPELFWMSGWGQWYTIFFNVVLIRGTGVRCSSTPAPRKN